MSVVYRTMWWLLPGYIPLYQYKYWVIISINGGEEKTSVRICHNITWRTSILNSMNNIGRTTNHIPDNTSRRYNNDKGNMHVIGEGYKGNQKSVNK